MTKVAPIRENMSVENGHKRLPDPVVKRSVLIVPAIVEDMKNSSIANKVSISTPSSNYKQDMLETKSGDLQVFIGSVRGRQDEPIKIPQAETLPKITAEITTEPIRCIIVLMGSGDDAVADIGHFLSQLLASGSFKEALITDEIAAPVKFAIGSLLNGQRDIPPFTIHQDHLVSIDEINDAIKSQKAESEGNSDKRERKAIDVESKKESESQASGRGDPLQRSGRLFGGVREDLGRRLPWYWSDFRDAVRPQCLSAVLFMFFAAFAPAITFGGLMSYYTEDMMGITETLVAQCVCGLIWGFCSAQPLTVVSITGPVLIFEASLYTFATALGLNFLTLRIWTGAWVFLIALVTVMFEGSFLVSYVTEYSEDIFSTLISIIFIKETIKFLLKTIAKNPVADLGHYARWGIECGGNESLPWEQESNCYASNYKDDCCKYNQPDTALTTFLLLVRILRDNIFKASRMEDSGCGSLNVLAAMVVVGVFDHVVVPGTYTEKLHMPPGLAFTDPLARNASLLIPLGLGEGQWWGYLFAAVPALLVYILLFVETEITELLLAKKERGLRKGTGYHWDLLLIGFLCFLCALFGLPWMCAAAVESLGHASSLTVMKKVTTAGERAKVDFVIEQRVTVIVSAILVGSCAFLGSFLSLIPMAAIYGIFLYLGLMSVSSVPLVHRIGLFFVPQKYHPDVPFCKKVGMWRMHLWTGSQVVCLVGVYLIKHFQASSLGFPFALATVAALRLFLVPKVFTDTEMQALDGHDEAEDENEEEVFPYSVF